MSTNKVKNYEKYVALNEIMVENIETILAELDLSLHFVGNKIVGSCPIHGGNNSHAFTIYLDGHSHAGNWNCYTNKCNKTRDFMGWNLVGFVQGVLSHNQYGWETEGDRVVSLNQAVEFILKTLKIDPASLKSSCDKSQVDFLRFVNTFNSAEKQKSNITRELVRSRLDIPAEYFLGRGFNWHILNSFDVGLCKDPTKPLFDRCVVPVYEKTGQFMLGATARSIYEQCSMCGEYHNSLSPCLKPDQSPKWLHSKGFCASHHLYNSWNAFKQIGPHNDSLIIVESPGNVWKLFEAGYPNTCAIFGSDLSDNQQKIIERSGAMNILLALDNDKAGILGEERIAERMGSLFNVKRLDKARFDLCNDIGEMPIQLIKEIMNDYRV